MSGDFYRAFEDRHRGSREMIKERLRAYLPFVGPLAAVAEGPAAFDIGCGRGEWLELLGENGFAARGVDIDDGMLAACRERGLSVETADGIAALRALPDNSLAVVSAFHLVEHLPFEAVQELAAQSLRVLQPGGLLIMETPNPENPMVGACHFYLDPSHVKPIPPSLLSFLAEHVGFARHKVMRLQEEAFVHTDAPIHLINVFASASPDYAVVAQKAAPADVLERFDAPFARAFGIGVGELANRFEAGMQDAIGALAELQRQEAASTGTRFAEINAALAKSETALAEIRATLVREDAKAAQLGDELAKADLRLTQHEARHNALLGELAELRTQAARAEAEKVQKEQELAALQSQLQATLGSTSWRITRPLRWVRRLFGSAPPK